MAHGSSGPTSAWDNNPKVAGRRYSYLRRLLWATPHGAAGSNLEEFRSFRPAHWRAQFAAAGFTVALVLPGRYPRVMASALTRLTLLERVGLVSEYAYVVCKTGHSSPYLVYFR